MTDKTPYDDDDGKILGAGYKMADEGLESRSPPLEAKHDRATLPSDGPDVAARPRQKEKVERTKQLQIAPGISLGAGREPYLDEAHDESAGNEEAAAGDLFDQGAGEAESSESSSATTTSSEELPGAFRIYGINYNGGDDDVTATHDGREQPQTVLNLEQTVSTDLTEPTVTAELVPKMQIAQVILNEGKRNKIFVALVGVFALVGLIVGLAIGLTRGDSSEATTPDPFEDLGWTQMGADLPGKQNGDEFGAAISLSADGNVMAVGAPGSSVNGALSGIVQVFRSLNGTRWVQLGSDLQGESAEDHFGSQVSLSADGNVLAVSAPHSSFNGGNSGSVYVFRMDGLDWTPFGETLHGESSDSQFGSSLSLSADGTVLAVGAPWSNGQTGAVRIFQSNETDWILTGNVTGQHGGDLLGRSVSLSANGTVLAIGSPNIADTGYDSGLVQVVWWNGVDWIRVGESLRGEISGDWLGRSISLSADGRILAVGADGNDDDGYDSGKVFVYQIDGTDWAPLGELPGENEYDRFGSSVALSADGNMLVAGAYGNDGNGSNSGHVRVYQLLNGAWEPVGLDLNGKDVEDRFGVSVAMSADGRSVAAGAPQEHKDGNPPGYARAYRRE